MPTPINNIGNLSGMKLSLDDVTKTSGTEKVGGFGDVLKQKLTELNDSQLSADSAAQDMATGKVEDVAQTMMRIEHANMSLSLATSIRNKAVEAYQDILRMQV